ncbi:hypothetical protein FXO38_12017 [Capsicum annuum]|uniref:Uncharacterized protein n=1 Tax=Capsicum annuum TaxID=4072 RepID=A0A2G2ZI87_CAPAN|nr:hypothetical protein FXO37_35456 [Capsicum annuum]KAF3660843.1 hypothetical protein FXO38_12017 [Capsicum annuum]PHT81702.1 hypothetical protein T459_14717 [Capsicum annuum]
MLCVGPTPITIEILDKYPSLECVVGTSAGFVHFGLTKYRYCSIIFTTVGDSFFYNMVDFPIGLLIGVLWRISVADRFVRGDCWPVE